MADWDGKSTLRELTARAEKAEAELARVRSLVEAAEVLQELSNQVVRLDPSVRVHASLSGKIANAQMALCDAALALPPRRGSDG